MPRYDLVLDGSDNFATRYLVNAACVAAGKPLVSAAMSQWEGQLAVFHPAGGGPCYQCLFPEPPDPALVPSCAVAGIDRRAARGHGLDDGARGDQADRARRHAARAARC